MLDWIRIYTPELQTICHVEFRLLLRFFFVAKIPPPNGPENEKRYRPIWSFASFSLSLVIQRKMKSTLNPLAAQEETQVTAQPADGSVNVGCRPCNLLYSFRYLFMIACFVIGLVVIFATPRECPSGYKEATCRVCDDDGTCDHVTSYDCRDGFTCASKRPLLGAIVGGVAIIIIGLIYGIIQCCHQARCILSDKHYDAKICFCC